jgi:hypothetical protein
MYTVVTTTRNGTQFKWDTQRKRAAAIMFDTELKKRKTMHVQVFDEADTVLAKDYGDEFALTVHAYMREPKWSA